MVKKYSQKNIPKKCQKHVFQHSQKSSFFDPPIFGLWSKNFLVVTRKTVFFDPPIFGLWSKNFLVVTQKTVFFWPTNFRVTIKKFFGRDLNNRFFFTHRIMGYGQKNFWSWPVVCGQWSKTVTHTVCILVVPHTVPKRPFMHTHFPTSEQHKKYWKMFCWLWRTFCNIFCLLGVPQFFVHEGQKTQKIHIIDIVWHDRRTNDFYGLRGLLRDWVIHAWYGYDDPGLLITALMLWSNVLLVSHKDR